MMVTATLVVTEAVTVSVTASVTVTAGQTELLSRYNNENIATTETVSYLDSYGNVPLNNNVTVSVTWQQ